MTSRVLIIGDGILSDIVRRRLTMERTCEVVHRLEGFSNSFSDDALGESDVGGRFIDIPEDTDLALVLDDGWSPAVHAAAEDLFRTKGIPWLRGFVAFGQGLIGPLVRPLYSGCSYCADLRTIMADAERRELFEYRAQHSADQKPAPDAWATRVGLFHMASILVAEVRTILREEGECRLIHQIVRMNLKTLDVSLHFVLPNGTCPVCGNLPDDSPEAAVITLTPNPKVSPGGFRTRSIADLQDKLRHDYLDHRTGLLNGKMHDLITPFAAVSVNLPLIMGDEGTSGRGSAYPECEPIAILEGLERFCGMEPRGKRTVVYDSYANLQDNALNPASLGLHSSEQYALPGFPFEPYGRDTPMEWVWGYSLTHERPILVPQRIAYYSLGYPDSFVYETSNGCAVGGSLVEAIFHGILEVVERDAFLMTWYGQLRLPSIDLSSSTDRELNELIERLRNGAGYDLHCFNATMEGGIPTAFVIAKNLRGHGLNLMCAAGAHVDGVRAIKGAIQENAGMLLRFDDKLENHRGTYLQMLQDSSMVRNMDDHSMLYGLPEAEERMDFLLDGNRPVQTLEEAFTWHGNHADLTEDLKDLLEVFTRLNLEVIVVNQTSPEIERNGLHCVKVIIPGMLPMTFGHHLTRLENLDRVVNVPMKLGYTKAPLTKEELNPYPHPFP